MMTEHWEAAAMHGIATNPAFPLADRLQAALQALAWYESEFERLTDPAVGGPSEDFRASVERFIGENDDALRRLADQDRGAGS